MVNKIYLITGLMASGKSTVSEILASRMERGVHLRGDLFRRMIVSGREDMSPDASEEALRQLRLRYEISVDAAKLYYDAGFTVVLQDNYYGGELQRMLDRLSGYPVQVVVLCPDAETLRRREQGRSKIGYSGYSIEALYQEFMAKTPRVGLWLDNSRQTAAETVEAILASTR